MACFQCPGCGYTYDEALGDKHEGYQAGMLWSEFQEDWPCPDCAVREKIDFVALDETSGDGVKTMSGFKKWQCEACGFIYDEAEGLTNDGIAPGTKWEDIPDDWTCSDCGAPKSDFKMHIIAENCA